MSNITMINNMNMKYVYKALAASLSLNSRYCIPKQSNATKNTHNNENPDNNVLGSCFKMNKNQQTHITNNPIPTYNKFITILNEYYNVIIRYSFYLCVIILKSF